MRLFIAIRLDPDAAQYLRSLRTALEPHLPRARWVDPENGHLTLAFLGEFHESKVPQIAKLLEERCGGRPSFGLSLRGIGAFPSWEAARVVWLGIEEGSREMIQIERLLREGLERLDISLESRAYHPHLTLCRIRASQKTGAFHRAADRWSAENPEPWTMEARRVELFESRLSPQGPGYRSLAAVELSGGAAERVRPPRP
ncbi:MAG: RNA 2',3'-cyclic phosphodiesterase [Elusimicrobia bacterium]|nr:RNA 2',3'-cyclic phosphodiesterase [Elusimicrobiota bacterium]